MNFPHISHLLLCIFIFCGSIFSQDIVKWKNGAISLEEFENDMLLYVHYNDKEKAERSSLEIRRKHLRGMLMKELIMLYAEDINLDSVKTLKEDYYNRLYAIAIVQHLLVDSVRSKIFSEQDIKIEYFHEMISSNTCKPFEFEKSRIIKSLKSKYKDQYTQEYNDFISRMFKMHNFKIDAVNLRNSIDLYNSFSDKYNAPKNDPLDYFNESQQNILIASYNGHKYLLKDFAMHLRGLNLNQRIKLNSLEDLNEFIYKYYKKILLRKTVDNIGYTKIEEIQALAKSNMIFDYKDYFINTQVRSKLQPIPENELQNYYNNNLSKFVINEKLLPFENVKFKIKLFLEKPQLTTLETLWEEYLFNKYDIKIDQLLLEKSFDYSIDQKY